MGGCYERRRREKEGGEENRGKSKTEKTEVWFSEDREAEEDRQMKKQTHQRK